MFACFLAYMGFHRCMCVCVNVCMLGMSAFIHLHVSMFIPLYIFIHTAACIQVKIGGSFFHRRGAPKRDLEQPGQILVL